MHDPTIDTKSVSFTGLVKPIVNGTFPLTDLPFQHLLIEFDGSLWIICMNLEMNDFRHFLLPFHLVPSRQTVAGIQLIHIRGRYLAFM